MKKGVRPFVLVYAAFFLLSFALCLFLLAPVFTVQNIAIEGISALCEKDVLMSAGLPPYGTKNYFLINGALIEKKISAMPYAAKCKVSKTFPDTIRIMIAERRVYGYIEDSGFYIYLDGEGRVLDVKDAIGENLPVAVGLKYASFKKGEKLRVEDESVFNTLASLGNLIHAYDFGDYYIRADINDSTDIRLYLYNIEIMLGPVSEINDRVRLLEEILRNFPDLENRRGTLDLNTAFKNEAARFRPAS